MRASLSIVLLIVLFMCILFQLSCVSAKYNPNTGLVSYQRFGDQELGGVEIIFDDGSSVSFEKQKATAQIFADMLKVIKEAYSAGLAAGAP